MDAHQPVRDDRASVRTCRKPVASTQLPTPHARMHRQKRKITWQKIQASSPLDFVATCRLSVAVVVNSESILGFGRPVAQICDVCRLVAEDCEIAPGINIHHLVDATVVVPVLCMVFATEKSQCGHYNQKVFHFTSRFCSENRD